MTQRTISLTGRRPVTIDEDEWPTIASASGHDGEVEVQAQRTWRVSVRQHADGRRLVYGISSSKWVNERDQRGGRLLAAGGDVEQAIAHVVEDLGLPSWLAQECIEDLPPEAI